MGCHDQSSRVAVEFVRKVRGKAHRPCGRGLKKPVSISGMDGSVSRDIQVAQNKKPKPEHQALAFWRLVLVPMRV
jgi:hypothetical protein